jgi:hypothetical protein
MRIRLWWIGAWVCIAFGIVNRILFAIYVAPFAGRSEMYNLACLEACCYGAGLSLLLIPVLRIRSPTEAATSSQPVGCALWLVGVLAALIAVISSMGP